MRSGPDVRSGCIQAEMNRSALGCVPRSAVLDRDDCDLMTRRRTSGEIPNADFLMDDGEPARDVNDGIALTARQRAQALVEAAECQNGIEMLRRLVMRQEQDATRHEPIDLAHGIAESHTVQDDFLRTPGEGFVGGERCDVRGRARLEGRALSGAELALRAILGRGDYDTVAYLHRYRVVEARDRKGRALGSGGNAGRIDCERTIRIAFDL